ncbi:nuclear valosin-containing protein-like isoform X3 [Bolinopsis microptera]|uniref:nuclear valosin-containing protein-like isoform X3 n=1 Tax=Bolinopsis microptera TaxID=2820187 RepID=UPI00307AF3A9
MQRGGSKGHILDKRLLQRINEYVDTQPKQKYITTDDVLAYLQFKFPEYQRKKKKALQDSVQKYLQDILVERHGPQSKKSRKKSVDVNDVVSLTSSNESEYEDVNAMPLMVAQNVNSLNNTMRNVYQQQSQSQPCSPLIERRDNQGGSAPNSPKRDSRKGWFIDRQPGQRNHSIASEQACLELHVNNLQHKSMEEYMNLRKEISSDGVINDEIAEEDEIVATKSSEIFEVIKENLSNKVETKSEADSGDADRKASKKTKMQKKTVVAVEDIAQSGNRKKNGGGNRRRESAPHYSRKYDSEKMRPNTEGVSNDEEDGAASRRASSSTRRRSSRMTDIRGSSYNADREYRNLVQTSITFHDMAGVEEVTEDISRLLVHLLHPEIFSTLGVTPTQGLLLHGPPGCGKTMLASAIAGELKLPFFSVTGTELISGFSGESEHNIRSLFRQARSLAPSILFIDEIDSICGKREEASKDMEKRIVTQLLSCIDDLGARAGSHVLLLAATSRPDTIDGSMRRAGRLDKEICLGIPNERQRIAILTKLCVPLKLEGKFDFHQIAHNTPGYVAADLVSLVREASLNAVSRTLPSLLATVEDPKTTSSSSCDSEYFNQPSKNSFRSMLSDTNPIPIPEEKLNKISITLNDFLEAVKHVQPSAKREGFATVPDVTWDDVGALTEIREELTMSILAPVKYPEKFAALGLTRSQGILIAGPPGCGKTLLAKAVSNESGINFISVKGPELLNMYVGESERAVRTVFQRARASAPCVIFFDEIDSLVPKRSSSETNASARVVNQLLTEMDGLNSRKNVFIIGATNRIDIIDPAILRPGRLDKTLFVGLPNAEDRLAILQTITRGGKPKLHSDVSLSEIADAAQGYTGADLSAIVREASVICLKADMLSGRSGDNCQVAKEHFTRALLNVRPSVSLTDRLLYEQMAKRGLDMSVSL